MPPADNPFTSQFLRTGAEDRLRPPGHLSYVSGPSQDPLKFMTIPQLLDRACARNGAAEAAIFAEPKTDYTRALFAAAFNLEAAGAAVVRE